MTDQHPLTDEICFAVYENSGHHPDEWMEDMRAGADWQLKQVIEWLEDYMRKYVYHDYYGADEQQEVFKTLEYLKQAMRPEVVDLPQANSDVCGKEGMERALQRTFEENDELMRKLADTTQ